MCFVCLCLSISLSVCLSLSQLCHSESLSLSLLQSYFFSVDCPGPLRYHVNNLTNKHLHNFASDQDYAERFGNGRHHQSDMRHIDQLHQPHVLRFLA
ncbi:hypothetical protein VTP01DRAFT_8700 [Rhizomucor pusillus]|uniref:uncharacterized protein n=1 Tax=Rhizomucor pusillus TaxID=4840 RepID=UPI003742F96B